MNSDPHFCDGTVLPEAVPLFPLPSVVLFPGTLLPLHIFEERYRAMTADALTGTRQIAMALLSPGWENFRHATPAIEPIVCVGTIVRHERLADGRYNILLRGDARSRIEHEIQSAAHPRPYRIARLTRMCDSPVMEIDLSSERQRLDRMLSASYLTREPAAQHMRQLLGSAMPMIEIVDRAAFHLLDDVGIKQSILAECDVRERIEKLFSALTGMELALNGMELPDAQSMDFDESQAADPTMN